ncbi:MAG TPA: hypothetical protein VFA00_04380 [Actinomycetota bacterium]|jgi:anti-anti-sigma regulatory factor|nr:hypothetical protein [Actinomycetota bacterium]
MEFVAEAAFWVMIGCALASIIGLFVTSWRRSAATIETWRQLAASPRWSIPSPDDVRVDALSVRDNTLITIHGGLTVEAADAVANCIRRLTSEGKNRLVVDISSAPLDSHEALARILAAAEDLHARGGTLGIVAPRQGTRWHTSLIDAGPARTYTELSDAFHDLLVS